ncbi:hypothetical protein Rhe02_68750 [Rhizocola hellebori]|uniref:Uncharacterized protein n=1 Tax=Rhizocola hellebori TaxID=1392758 RepID=A0A8J3QDC6_9ACTN|nr:hypothetical protein [Rhizocola hellebori]GIH08808.1 hypothetical protein Rhe02_68750 [Rhizocola hellebori]
MATTPEPQPSTRGTVRSGKARILGRIAAALILLPILIGIVLQVLNLLA